MAQEKNLAKPCDLDLRAEGRTIFSKTGASNQKEQKTPSFKFQVSSFKFLSHSFCMCMVVGLAQLLDLQPPPPAPLRRLAFDSLWPSEEPAAAGGETCKDGRTFCRAGSTCIAGAPDHTAACTALRLMFTVRHLILTASVCRVSSPDSFSNTQWGCCLLAHAVDCGDSWHCCAQGESCSYNSSWPTPPKGMGAHVCTRAR